MVYARAYFVRLNLWQLAAVRKLHIFANDSKLAATSSAIYLSNSIWAELAHLRLPAPSGVPNRARTLGGPFPEELTITVPSAQRMGAVFDRAGNCDLLGLFGENDDWKDVLDGVHMLRIRVEALKRHEKAMRVGLEHLRRYSWRIDDERRLLYYPPAHIPTSGSGPGAIEAWHYEHDMEMRRPNHTELVRVSFVVFELEWRLERQSRPD